MSTIFAFVVAVPLPPEEEPPEEEPPEEEPPDEELLELPPPPEVFFVSVVVLAFVSLLYKFLPFPVLFSKSFSAE